MREDTARGLRDAVDALGAIASATLNLLDRRLPESPPLRLDPPERPLAALPAVLRAVPGLAGEFTRSVPPEYVDALPDDSAVVRCTCGVPTSLRLGVIEECDGGCGRWFVRTEIDVRVARWEPCEVGDRYAGEGWTPLDAAA